MNSNDNYLNKFVVECQAILFTGQECAAITWKPFKFLCENGSFYDILNSMNKR